MSTQRRRGITDKSKDELILAALRRRDERFRNEFMRAVEHRGQTPRERLLAVFEVLAEWLGGDDFHGCMFINACAEFARQDDPIHAAAAEHKRLMLGYVTELARAAEAADPQTLAGQLCLLLEGAIVLAQVTGRTDVASEARAAAETLLFQAIIPRYV